MVSEGAYELNAVQHVVVVVVVQLKVVKVLLFYSHLLFRLVDNAVEMVQHVFLVHVAYHLIVARVTRVSSICIWCWNRCLLVMVVRMSGMRLCVESWNLGGRHLCGALIFNVVDLMTLCGTSQEKYSQENS